MMTSQRVYDAPLHLGCDWSIGGDPNADTLKAEALCSVCCSKALLIGTGGTTKDKTSLLATRLYSCSLTCSGTPKVGFALLIYAFFACLATLAWSCRGCKRRRRWWCGRNRR